MNNVYIPTTEDIYKICYLTMNDWKFSSYENKWKKEGQFTKVPPSVKQDSYGYYTPDEWEDSELWDLEDAYDHQLELERK